MIPWRLRPGEDRDGEAMRALIAACWAEYPGCVMDENENAHLRAPATYYAAKGGMLTLAEAAGDLVGCVSAYPEGGDTVELKGLYLAASVRGTGIARALLDAVEAFARGRGAARVILWSDTRFTRAHRFYEREGFTRAGATRKLGDLSNSVEYPYAKALGLP